MQSNYTNVYKFRSPGGMPPASFKKLLTIGSIIAALFILSFIMRGTGNLIMSAFHYIILIPVILVSLSFHEYSHARMADFLGDPTPRRMGRLTLNPLRHLDFIGSMMLFFTSFGWAKPVVVDPRNFRIPKRAMVFVALAGPLSNIFLAFIGALGMKFIATFISTFSQNQLLFIMSYKAVELFIIINLGLAFFNMLPLPPLDGSRITAFFMPAKYRVQYRQFEEIAPFILLILFMVGGLGPIISPFIINAFDVMMSMLNHPNREIGYFLMSLTNGVRI